MLYGVTAIKDTLQELESKAASDDEHVGLSEIESLQFYSCALGSSEKSRAGALVFAVLRSSSSLAQQQRQQQSNDISI